MCLGEVDELVYRWKQKCDKVQEKLYDLDFMTFIKSPLKSVKEDQICVDIDK